MGLALGKAEQRFFGVSSCSPLQLLGQSRPLEGGGGSDSLS